MRRRFFTAGEIEALGGPPVKTLTAICRDSGIVPAIQSPGSGRPHMFSQAQAFALCLGRWLRRKGWALHPAGSVMSGLLAMTEQRLLEDFDAGRTHMLLINGSAMPWLCHPETIHQNPDIDRLMLEATAAALTVKIQTIDIGSAWADFASKLARKSRRAAAAKR